MSDFTIILRSLTSRLFSTVTTVATVAVAVALMLVLLTTRDAGQRAFDRDSGDMHFLVSADASPLVSVLNGIFYANAPRRPLTWERFKQLERTFPWQYAIPTQLGDTYRSRPVMATTTDFFAKFKPNPGEDWRFTQGRAFERSFEVVLGSSAAAATGLKIGDDIALSHGASDSREPFKDDDHDDHDHSHAGHTHDEFKYKVVGILAPTGGSHDRALFTDLASTWIIHAHEARQKADPKVTTTVESDLKDEDRKITGVYLRLIAPPGSTIPTNFQQVFDMLRRDASITVAQPGQEISTLFKIVSNIDRLFIAIAAVVMLSSGISIMLALYNSMEQRRRQIAVFRVLGASRGRVFGLIAAESIVIGMLGAISGFLLSIVGGMAAAAALKDRLGLVIEPNVDPRSLVAVLLAAILLAGLAGLVPAFVAYRSSVSRSLRPLG
jgi:putative ABC transport system permease protein